jgi:hypothetical protein
MFADFRVHGAPVQGEAWWKAGKEEDEMTAATQIELVVLS